MNNCVVHKNTGILTIDGYKQIYRIVVGDMVLTHKNRWRKVLATKKVKMENQYIVETHIEDEALTLKGTIRKKRRSLALTGEHLVLSEGFWRPTEKVKYGESVTMIGKEFRQSIHMFPSIMYYGVNKEQVKKYPPPNWKEAEYYFSDIPIYGKISYRELPRHFYWDISVDDDESYIANGFVIHNCC